QSRVRAHRHLRPIVAAGATQVAVVEAKADPPDKVQRRPGGGTQAGDVAGIRRDFRFPQRDMNHPPTPAWTTAVVAAVRRDERKERAKRGSKVKSLADGGEEWD